MSDFTEVAAVPGPPEQLRVYEHGWQSWSPAGLYPATLPVSPRPRRERWQAMAFRPERPAPVEGFQGEGLLAVVHPDGTATLWATPRPTVAVPSVRAAVEGGRLVIRADGPVQERHGPSLAAVVEAWAAEHAVAGLPTLQPGWCSWYCRWNQVTEQDMAVAAAAVHRLDLPIDVVQLDDGYNAGVGDWLTLSPRFTSLADVAARITDVGRRPGIWTAPFLVGRDSELARSHPDWLVQGAIACEHHWGQPIGVLDVTNPDAAEHLVEVFRQFRALGFRYFKCDFLYGGAMEGRRYADADPIAAYRRGMELIREGIGADAQLLGCGAPLLASIGLVDAMRISPDVDPRWEPDLGDISQPGMRSALAAERARRWMHGRFWLNDPDCLVVRPEVADRHGWAAHVQASAGLVVASDVLDDLDPEGLELLRGGLRPSAPVPVPWVPVGGDPGDPDGPPVG